MLTNIFLRKKNAMKRSQISSRGKVGHATAYKYHQEEELAMQRSQITPKRRKQAMQSSQISPRGESNPCSAHKYHQEEEAIHATLTYVIRRKKQNLQRSQMSSGGKSKTCNAHKCHQEEKAKPTTLLLCFPTTSFHSISLNFMFVFRSLLLHFQDWYSDLTWPFDEDETLLGMRYVISGILTGKDDIQLFNQLKN